MATVDSGTPDVTFTYARLGQKHVITDGVGTRTFDYDDDDTEAPITNRLHVVSEAIEGAGDFDGLDKTITRDYGTGKQDRFVFDEVSILLSAWSAYSAVGMKRSALSDQLSAAGGVVS